jgi:hypothetical protein
MAAPVGLVSHEGRRPSQISSRIAAIGLYSQKLPEVLGDSRNGHSCDQANSQAWRLVRWEFFTNH